MTDKEIKKKFPLAIDEITKNIIDNYDPNKIILFGSVAKGRYNENSDIDMLIIKQTKKPFIERWVEVGKMANYLKHDISFEPHVYTPQEFQKRLDLGDFFTKEILETGSAL